MSAIRISNNTLRSLVESVKLPVIEYDPNWANGTGYFDGLVDPEVVGTIPLDDGQMALCYDDKDRMMLVGRYHGEVYVMFERYTPKAGHSDSTIIFQHAGPPAESLLRHLLEIEGTTVSTNELQKYLLAFDNTATLISLIQREVDDAKHFARQQASNPQAVTATTVETTSKENDSMNNENTQNNAAQTASTAAEEVKAVKPQVSQVSVADYSNWKKAGWAAGGLAVGAAVGYGAAALFGTDWLDGLFD